jgi:hypothetical protein
LITQTTSGEEVRSLSSLLCICIYTFFKPTAFQKLSV